MQIPTKTKIIGSLVLLLVVSVVAFSGSNGSIEAQKPPQQKNQPDEKIEGESKIVQDLNRLKFQALMADITSQMDQPNISREDIERGWYIAKEEGKRYGTPKTWIFIEEGEESRWISPNVLEELAVIKKKTLCEASGGDFIFSCLESSEPECQYIGQSQCACPEGFAWNEDQGCLPMPEEEVLSSKSLST